MSGQPTDGTEQSEITTCPGCGEPMYADEDWQITDRSLTGTEIGDEGIEGDYAHARCVNMETDRSGSDL